MRVSITGPVLIAALAASACQEVPTSPQALSVNTSVATDRSTGDTPNYNLEVILSDVGCFSVPNPASLCASLGHVKFRQPGNDDAHIVYLDVWVRDLEPNTEYQLQRAVDTILDGNCTSTGWLTLGKGLVPQSITTDEKGTGREDLFRVFSPASVGSTFDIYFRVIRKDNSMVVLRSECYQFTVK